MADKRSDPVEAWRNMLGEWERNVNAFANKAMEREDFAKAMGAATNAGTTAQGALGDVMQRYLSTLNLPSRADLATIGERLGAVEAQISQLTALVRTVPGVTAPVRSEAPKPARTRRPPDGQAAPPRAAEEAAPAPAPAAAHASAPATAPAAPGRGDLL